MTNELLEEALLFFPTPQQRGERAFLGWRAHIDMLREYLAALDPSDRRSVFDAACERIQSSSFRDQRAMPLWFFSHPTFEVFEEFLQDSLVCRALADYFEICSAARGGKHKRVRRRLRYLANISHHEGHLLPLRYMHLLQAHQGGNYFEHFHLYKQKLQHRITLVVHCEEEINEASAQAIYAEAEQKILQQEYEAFVNSLERVHFTELSRIYGYEQAPEIFFNEEVFRSLVREALVEFEVSDFILVYPHYHQPLHNAAAVMIRAMRSGTWIKFHIETRRQVSVCAAKTIVHKMDMAVLNGIRSHRARTLSKLQTRLKGIESRMQRVKHGLLSVGLKIHCAAPSAPGIQFLKKGYFAAHNAGTCFNLPPVGSTEAVAELLEVIQKRARVSYLDNPDFQIQVCSPGMLSPKFAARLGIAFYLGSDRIRRYTEGDFITTHQILTSDRLVIYGDGVLDRSFEWWGKDSHDALLVGALPSKMQSRTDVLTCQSMRDIENVNLVATLLVHVQWNGYWETLGREFIEEMDAMLGRHQLGGLLDASWCKPAHRREHQDREFVDALNELVNYAYDEVTRLTRARERGEQSAASHSILYEMQELLHRYRAEIMVRSSMKGGES